MGEYSKYYKLAGKKYSAMLYDSSITSEEYMDKVHIEVSRMIKIRKLKQIINND